MRVALQEVEAKYRVLDDEAVAQRLADHGISLSESVRQDDQAYAPNEWNYGLSKVGVSFARLRTQDGRHLFTLKKPIDNEMTCLEFETVIADREQMHLALLQMGFRPTVRIVKNRRTGSFGDVTVCLDELEDVGLFLEVERVVSAEDDGLKIQSELDDFVASINLRTERLSETYDSLVRSAAMQTS
jgi:adenylate cyclase, class 2